MKLLSQLSQPERVVVTMHPQLSMHELHGLLSTLALSTVTG